MSRKTINLMEKDFIAIKEYCDKHGYKIYKFISDIVLRHINEENEHGSNQKMPKLSKGDSLQK
jgi:hypothetical protein